MFCGPHNNYCGTGAAPAYTSDAGFASAPLATDALNNMGTLAAPLATDPLATMNAQTYGMDSGDCNGRIVPAGSKTEYVDCPTTRAIQENYVVPRTVVGSRLETRTRTRNEVRQRIVPITKFRNETKMVPVSRQVAYQDYKTESYPVPVPENYTVTIPTTKIVNETRTRTRTIPGTKKCPVNVPVYSATCNANASNNLNQYDTGMNQTFDTGMPSSFDTTGYPLGTTGDYRDITAMPATFDTTGNNLSGQYDTMQNTADANMGDVQQMNRDRPYNGDTTEALARGTSSGWSPWSTP